MPNIQYFTKRVQRNEVLVYEREYGDGYVYYVEEKRDRRKSLSFQTMYKKKKGADSSDGLMPEASPSTPLAPSDNLISSFGGKGTTLSADAEVSRIRCQAELNTVDVGERRMDAMAADRARREVAAEAARVNDVSVDDVLDVVRRGDEGKLSGKEREFYERYKAMVEVRLSNADYTKEAVRGAVERAQREEIERIKAKAPSERTVSERKVLEDYEAGGEKVSVYDALKVMPERRTDLEQKLVDDYSRELYGAEAAIEGGFQPSQGALSDTRPDVGDIAPDKADEAAEAELQRSVGRPLTEQESGDLVSRMGEQAEVAPELELTADNWIAEFGEDGIVDTPLGAVKMGANQYAKMSSRNRGKYFGMIRPTLEFPDVIIEKSDPRDDAERDSKYLFVKTFVKPDGGRVVHFESVTVKKDGMEVSVSSHEAEERDIKKDMQRGVILHISKRLSLGSEWSLTEAPNGSERPDLVPTSDVFSFGGKGSESLSDEQVSERMREAEAGLVSAFEGREEMVADVHDDAWSVLGEPDLTGVQRGAVLDYINALDGVDVSSAEAEAIAVTRRRRHRQSGKVIVATTATGEQVFLVSGNVRMYSDGKGVDRLNSDSFVVVCDGRGHYRMMSPEMLSSVGEGVEAAEYGARRAAVTENQVRGERLAVSEPETDEANEADTPDEVGDPDKPNRTDTPDRADEPDRAEPENQVRGERLEVSEPGAEESSERPRLSAEKDVHGHEFVVARDGGTTFGYIDADSGLTEAPICLSVGENYVGDDGRNHGYGLLHIEAEHGAQIRESGWGSIEEFVEDVARNYDTIREGNEIAGNQTYLLEVSDVHNNTLFVQLSNDGRYWNVNSAGIFRKKYSRRKPEVKSLPTIGSSSIAEAAEVNHGQSNGETVTSENSSLTSKGKGSTLSSDVQGENQVSGDGLKVSEASAPDRADMPDGSYNEVGAQIRERWDAAANENVIAMIDKQWHDIKEKHPNTLLIFRNGDSYELLYDDAKTVAGMLGLNLVKGSTGKSIIPLTGFPVQELDAVLPKLVRAGLRVAIFEQDENPKRVDNGVAEHHAEGDEVPENQVSGDVSDHSDVSGGGRASEAEWQRGDAELPPSGESEPRATEPSERGGGTEADSRTGRNDEEHQYNLPKIVEVTSVERTEMASRIVDWLSDENLSKAFGKTREEIFDEFGNALEPIAYLPPQFVQIVSPTLTDPRIYCGKGYFIDHALRNHGGSGRQTAVEDVDVSKYLNIQTVLDNPDYIKETSVDGKRTVVFIKKIGRYFAELTQVEEGGKIVLHKFLFNQKKEPYAKLNDIRQKVTSSEGGDSSISHAENSAPAISLESRDDVISSEKDEHIDKSPISTDKGTTLSADEQADRKDSEENSGIGEADNADRVSDEVAQTDNVLVDEVTAMEAAMNDATSRNDMVRSRELRDRLDARLGELSDAELDEVAEFSSYARGVLWSRRQGMSDSDVLMSRASDEDVVAGSDVRIKPKRKKFVMHSLCGDKSAPAAMRGVYHDGEHGVAVATDAHVMIVSRKDYDASLAGKVVDKKGNEVATGYLGYERVVPAENSPVSVDYDDLLSFVTGALDVEKNPGAYGFDVSKSPYVIIRFGDGRVGFYDLKQLEKFVRGAQHLGVQTIDLTASVSKSAQLLSARNETGAVVLISAVPGDGIRYVSPFVYDVDKVRGERLAVSEGERWRAIQGLSPIEVARNDYSRDELREIYNRLPSVEKDGRKIEFYRSAFKKIYKDGGVFGQIVPCLDDVLRQSVLAYSEADNLGGVVRPDGSEHKSHPNVESFDNYVGKVMVDGKEYYVRTTVQRSEKSSAGTHSFMATEVSVYEKTDNGLSLPITTRARGTTAGIVDAKLQQFIERASVEEQKAARVEELARKLGARVRIVRTAAEIADLENRRQRRAKGWYDTATGDVVVVLPNNADVADVENTMLHEIVGHDGLRVLFPEEEKLNNALDELYRVSDAGIRAKIDGMAQKMYEAEVERLREKKRKEHEELGEDASAHYYADMAEARIEADKKRARFRRDATEEYAAEVAGRVGEEGFERMSADERTFWGRLRGMLERALRRLLEGLKIRTLRKWGDREWAYVLHEAYKRKRNGGRPTVFDRADTALMRYKVDGSATGSRGSDKGDVSEDIEVVNQKFNEELQQQIDGKLPSNHIYKMGRPGEVLLSTGVPNLPIQMGAKRLQDKATLFDHDFDLEEVKNLVKALQEPLAVFAYGDKAKAQNIIVPLQKDGKNFIVGLSINPTVGGRSLEINSIRNVFPKDNSEWLNWMTQGKALFLDKERIQDLIDQQRTNLADVDYLDLDSVAKVVENFENPKGSGEKESEEGMIRYRDGDDMVSRERVYARALYEPVIRTSLYQVTEAFQDSMLGLKALYKAVEGAAGGEGRDVTDIPDYENAYLAEN